MKGLARLVLAAVVLAGVVSPTEPAWADGVRAEQWQLGFLHVDEAHQYSQGTGVIVAVLDSGVDSSHPDLLGNVLPGADVQAGGNALGTTDTNGHGTAMAGLIAAHGHGPGNSLGALGIAPRAMILPVKDGDGHGTALPSAIDWAVANGAKVISISQGNDADDFLDRRAIEDALSRDVVVVAAAGNIPGTAVNYPAAYPGVIAVAGVDQQGNHAEVSLTGPQVALAAPAVNVMRPSLGHGYGLGTGTSDATAIVAGAAALVRAKYPNLSATEVVHRLTATAIDKGAPGRDDVYGYGIVNLVGALTADVPPLQSPTPTAQAQPVPRKAAPWLPIGIGVALLVVAVLGILALARRRSR